jgi:hypothetical protein
MAALDTFLVTCNGIGAIDVDYVDAGVEPDEHPVYAFVDFIPRLPAGTVIWAPTLTPARGVQLDTIRGRFSPEDGILRTIIGDPTNERQHVVVTGSPTSFTLTLTGSPTASITTAGITNSLIQTRIENLAEVGAGNVVVTGAYPNFNVQFKGSLTTTNLPQMTGTATGGSSPLVTVTTLEDGDAEAGVRLVANTTPISTPLTALGISSLIYDVVFTIPESDRKISSFGFTAPTTTNQTLDLASVTRLRPAEGL